MIFTDAPYLDIVARVAILGPIALMVVLVATKVVGLRTFSKMTTFDFVTTVATGSLLAAASTSTAWPAFLQNTGAILVLLAVQMGLALIRKRSDTARSAMANDPILLMRDGKWHSTALETTRVSKSDVWAKLREANACHLSKVRAVVLESTGDISVLHADNLDETLLHGVRSIGDTQ
ncbi:MAG: YetF domain-containing protein [Pseudomonadota bacterium]